MINKDLKMSTGKIVSQISHLFCDFHSMATPNYSEWKRTGAKKVILKASLEDIMKSLNTSQIKSFPTIIIRDAGKTEIKPNSLTCIGIGPIDDKNEDFGHIKLF